MIINLLSNPRNISTALMYAFAQRKDCTVLDEPFYAYYLHRTGVQHPGRAEILAAQPLTYDGVMSWIASTYENSDHLFIKNMAHHLRGLEASFLQQCFNIIFIRHPKKVLASFSRVVSSPTLEDIAIRDQFELTTFFKENNTPYVVLDSADLIADPIGILGLLCESAGLSFDVDMLTWETGPKPYDGVWAPHWYGRVHQSTSFVPAAGQSENPLPGELQPVLEEALSYYSQLRGQCLSSKKTW